jgi:hypothetical protein
MARPGVGPQHGDTLVIQGPAQAPDALATVITLTVAGA